MNTPSLAHHDDHCQELSTTQDNKLVVEPTVCLHSEPIIIKGSLTVSF